MKITTSLSETTDHVILTLNDEGFALTMEQAESLGNELVGHAHFLRFVRGVKYHDRTKKPSADGEDHK